MFWRSLKTSLIMWITVLVALSQVVSAQGTATQPGVPIDPDGRPAGYQPGAPRAYWIWRDNDGFHLRTTTAQQRHVFSGWVRVEGPVVLQTRPRMLESNDFIRVVESRIEFRFTTRGAEDGFDFRGRWPHLTTFSLQIDGSSGRDVLERTFIGRDGEHPRSNPFTLGPRGGATFGELDPRGRPAAFQIGQTRAYFLWRDDAGYHLRATTASEKHIFSGWVEVEGDFRAETPVRLEPVDFIAQQGQRLYFHFVVSGNVDGVDFRVTGPRRLTLFLMIDGETGGILNRVFVGERNTHPASNPFTVR